MNSEKVYLINKIRTLLKILFWIVIIAAFSLSIWYSTIITRPQEDWTSIETSFISGWRIAQTFITCITLPLGLLKLYNVINSLRLNGVRKRKLQNEYFNRRRMEMAKAIDSKKNNTQLYIKNNKIKTKEDFAKLIIFSASQTRKLEGTILMDINDLFKSIDKKLTKEHISKLIEIVSNYDPRILESSDFRTALKYLK